MNETLSVAVGASAVVGALVGYLGAVATFKAEFVRVDERHEALKDQIERDRKSDDALRAQEQQTLKATLDRIGERQLTTMRLVADLFRAMSGHPPRAIGDDAVARFLAEEDGK